MKKLLIISFFSVSLGFFLYKSQSHSDSNNFSAMEMANLEALTDNESGGLTVQCFCKTNWFSSNVCSANASGSYCGTDPCANHDSNCR